MSKTRERDRERKREQLQESRQVVPGSNRFILEVPIDREHPPSAWVLHIDAKLTPRQSTALRRIASQLDREQARLESGQRVVHPTQALKYLLEQVP